MKRSISGTRQRKRGPNGCQEKINQRLRQDMWKGVYRPGARLPTHEVLKKIYHTTSHTIQRSLDKLVEDGFARADGPKGTFVADNPPCLSRYAIVFPFHMDIMEKDGTFYQILARISERKGREAGVEFSSYTGLNGHTDEPDYRRLMSDLHSFRLAGIIFTSPPHLLEKTPLFKEIFARKDLPKVAFMNEPYPLLLSIATPPDDFLSKSLDLFQSRGCRRLAILGGMSEDVSIYHEEKLPYEAKRRGMELRPEWLQVMHFNLKSRARQMVRLLLQGQHGTRPDALLITDSVFVQAAMKAIEELGLDPSRDITVVSHCNYPEQPDVSAPVTFIGLNIESFLDACLNIMNRQRNGSSNPPLTLIPLEQNEHPLSKDKEKNKAAKKIS